MLEIHDLVEFDAHVERAQSLDGVVVQAVDSLGALCRRFRSTPVALTSIHAGGLRTNPPVPV